MTRNVRRIVVAASLALVACNGNVSQPAPTASSGSPAQSALQTEPPQRGHGRGRHGWGRGGGGMRLIRQAIESLSLSDAQRAKVQQLADTAATRHALTRTAFKDIVDMVAAQIEDGRINRVALQPKIAAIKSQLQTTHAADRAAIEQLHGVLTAEQRTQLVTTIEKRMAEHRGRRDHAWRADGATEATRGRDHFLGKWAADLQLTPQQLDQIRPLMRARLGGRHHKAAFDGMRDHLSKMLTAFKGEKLEMSSLTPVFDPQLADGRGEKMLSGIEAALPLLTPAQRVTLAQKLRAFRRGPGHSADAADRAE
jgi:Spy/CpxP family protein refolding chaperone